MTKNYTDIKSPFTGGKVFEVHDTEEKIFRGEKYSVNVSYYLCEDTGEQFTDSSQDSLWTEDLYNQYRTRHGIPSPEEIKSVRTGYGMNYAQMSRILGFGVNQLKNYEDGQVPSESNGKMLKLISDPLTLMNLLEISREEFSVSEFKKLKEKIALTYLDKQRQKRRMENQIMMSSPTCV